MNGHGIGRMWAITAAALLLSCELIATFGAAQTKQTKPVAKRPSTSTAQVDRTPSDAAKQALVRAHYYYNNDDTSDEAAKRYRQVITAYPGTREAETARYFIGAYYHRKYYIRKERGMEDNAALDSSEAGYLNYVKAFGNTSTPQWLSDSYFNLALIALQRGEERRAREYLQSLNASISKDKSVYLYQIVWSPKSSAVIDWFAPAQLLANTTIGLLDGKLANQAMHQAGPPKTFNDRINWLTSWCKSQRG